MRRRSAGRWHVACVTMVLTVEGLAAIALVLLAVVTGGARLRADRRALAWPRLRLSGVALLAAAAFAWGVAVRVRPVALTDFPLNDGGMFHSIIDAIRLSMYALPERLSYNGIDGPLAYPPLAFYAAAAAADAFGLTVPATLRVLPVVFSALGVLAFWRLARELLGDALGAAIATMAYAVVPASYAWLVMGGGLTRSLGVLFALLALGSAAAFARGGRQRDALAAGALGGLTVVTHLEFAWFAAYGTVLVLALHRAESRPAATLRARLVRAGPLMVAGGLAIAAPWVVVSVARHGLTPFVQAFGTGALDNPVESLLSFRQTLEPSFPLFAALGLLGCFLCATSRRPLLPAWLVAIALLNSRSFGTLSAVPLALMAAIAIQELLWPRIAGRRRVVAALATAALAYGLTSSIQAAPDYLTSLRPEERAAMEWASRATPPGSRFLVVSERGWADDRTSEWFPVLSGRRSVATVQGTEWLPGRAFWEQLKNAQRLQECGGQDTACLHRWEARWGDPYDYVYLPKTTVHERLDKSVAWCCTALRASLGSDPGYELAYEGPGAHIYRRR